MTVTLIISTGLERLIRIETITTEVNVIGKVNLSIYNRLLLNIL